MEFNNGEKEVKIHSVIVHETDTGYAECFRDDAYNFKNMGEIRLEDIIFSNRIKEEWHDKMIWEKILKGERLKTPLEI
jgi:6-pyruvoyltetrahydropterin/6-carboxytetrahydropterin synthase